MKIDQHLLCESWKKAGEECEFDVETPYIARTRDGIEVFCIAHLPDFGSSNGMIVGAVSSPSYEINIEVKQIAKELGKYCSYLNAVIYEKYDQEVFKEALIDWGFWGSEEKKPKWLQDHQT